MSLSEPFVIHEEQCEFEGRGEAAPGSVRWRTLISGVAQAAQRALQLRAGSVGRQDAITFFRRFAASEPLRASGFHRPRPRSPHSRSSRGPLLA